MSAELLALADRCEAAKGAYRGLDVDIVTALGRVPPEYERAEIGGTPQPFFTHFQFPAKPDWVVARYTASIDAALTLSPEGWNWMAGNRDQPKARAYVEAGKGLFPERGKLWFEVVAATPALALCAAALRARATGEA